MACQNCADTTTGYMQQLNFPTVKELEAELMFCSTHFTLHFLYGLEIIGYYHPDRDMAQHARDYYQGLVSEFAMRGESKEELEARLQDK